MNRLIALIAMLVLCAGCQPEQISLNSEFEIGAAFPAIEGTDIFGEPISTAEFKGKVVLLDFFGDW